MNWKLILLLVLFLLAVIFTAQNHEAVEIHFLFWSFLISKAIIIFLSFFVGVVIGLSTSILIKKKKQAVPKLKTEKKLPQKENNSNTTKEN